ncbi:hypothetical protein GSI_12617 [Ganoderma sinense ZZ0214-1]|uniref:Uncharacterized protein n=1 Tax=Ganoderma sinense ZZ0214-1 TaxID=1077348 RepID=A0A2G8RT92_9APHY|nr:hypothetical protein GSI_12617 [Ganoderma sinense ZZ0214-1]
MTALHLAPAPVADHAGQKSSPQVQRSMQVDGAGTRDTQEPLYPPGLGFSPPLRPIACARGLSILGDGVVEYRNGSSLLDGPLVGLGLHGVAIDRALDEAQTARILPAVCLGLPWPPVVDVEHVLHWPPQVALHEERMAGPGLQLSTLDDFNLEAKNLMPLYLERACTGFSCSLCVEKASDAPGTSCEVEPINPEEYMDFTFLDEDDDPLAPSRPPAPYVEKDESDLDSLEESDTASTLIDDGSACSGSPPSPTAPQRPVYPMKDGRFCADVTLGTMMNLWREEHAPGYATRDALVALFIEASERAPPDPEPLWQPSQLSRVEERDEEDET